MIHPHTHTPGIVRSRSHLEPDQQERLDALSAEIGALFSEPLESVDLSAATAAVEGLSDDPVGEICWGQLQVGRSHKPR